MFSSITKIRSLVRKSLLSWTHFWGCCSIGVHSFIHFFQKESTSPLFPLYEDPLGQTAPVAKVFLWSSRWFLVSGSWSFESSGVRWRLFSIVMTLARTGFSIHSRHAHFQGSLSWFCGHFESFYPRSHSYGWWITLDWVTTGLDFRLWVVELKGKREPL